jgi:transcriptional regulator with XRE-family HTH domain
VNENEVSTIGRNVAAARKKAKMSAEDLAALAGAGLTRSIVANLENGRKDDVTVSQLIALAYVLGVNPAALVFDIYDPYGYTPVLRTENSDVDVQQWLAFGWFGGQLTPNELVARVDGIDIGAPTVDADQTWIIRYLTKQRGDLLFQLNAQQSRVQEMQKNALAHDVMSQLPGLPEYQDAKAKIRDYSAELYGIEGQLRTFKVNIDKPVTHPGDPF